jgi:Flp pilus assembly protein TadG
MRGSHGQAAVELVALLPLVAAVLAVAWQIALAGHAAWAASAAARAAARAAAVGGDPRAAARAHLPRRLEGGLRVRETGGRVTVSLRRPSVLPSLRLGRSSADAAFPQQ